MNRLAEYVCGCRSCGNHCIAIERNRAVEDDDEVLFTDGFLGGWQGIQTEVITCPHCGIVISWRKNCEPAEQLRRAGDLGRFYLPTASWGPPPLYWAGFQQYDERFHPGEPKARKGTARLTRAPEADALWALRKRGWLARGLLWLENDRDRTDFFFGPERPPPRKDEDRQRRTLLLRALLEAAQFGGDDSEAACVETAEWHRELGEWDAAARVLERDFRDRVLGDRARQLAELVSARIDTVMPFDTTALKEKIAQEQFEIERERAELERARVAFERERAEMDAERERERAQKKATTGPADGADSPPAASGPAKKDGKAEARTPRVLLATLEDVLGSLPADILTRDHIPRPYGSLLRALMKSSGWDEDSFAVAVIRGFARAHDWPAEANKDALEFFEALPVDEAVLDYLATAFKRATWDQWAFDVPGTPAPKAA